MAIYRDKNGHIGHLRGSKTNIVGKYQSGPPNIRSLICHMAFKVLLGLPLATFWSKMAVFWPKSGQNGHQTKNPSSILKTSPNVLT